VTKPRRGLWSVGFRWVVATGSVALFICLFALLRLVVIRPRFDFLEALLILFFAPLSAWCAFKVGDYVTAHRRALEERDHRGS
jgi:hypothetical protein